MNRRRILSFLLCLLTAAGITLSGTASAHAEYTITSYACIRADYEDSITPSQGDRFELSYKLNGGTNIAKITVNANEINDEIGGIPLTPGQYLITGIAYRGTNSEIEKQGYAVTSGFTASVKGGSTIQLAIGKKKAEALNTRYSDVIKAGGTTEAEEASETDSSSTEESSDSTDASESSSEAAEDTADSDSQKSETESSSKSDEKKTDGSKVKSKTYRKSSSEFARLFVLFGLVAVGIAVYLVLRRKEIV